MPAPERTFTEEFFSVDPPVIPVKFTRPKGRGKPGPISQKGFEGFKLINVSGKWKCLKVADFTVKMLGDGYAEIPKTANNIKLLESLSKPMEVKPVYDRGISIDVNDPKKFYFKNNKGIVKHLDEKALEDGEIRMIRRAHTLEPIVKALKSKRKFDVTDPRSNDAELAQKVRPWLLQFVKVNEAQIEAAAI